MVVESKIAIATVLVDLNLTVQYGIAVPPPNFPAIWSVPLYLFIVLGSILVVNFLYLVIGCFYYKFEFSLQGHRNFYAIYLPIL